MPDNDPISHANDETFEAIVINNALPVLADFWAPWCEPCHTIASTVEELAKDYRGRAAFVKVNVDEARNTASVLGVTSVPTIILFNHGKPIKRQAGVQPKSVLNEMIEESLVGIDWPSLPPKRSRRA